MKKLFFAVLFCVFTSNNITIFLKHSPLSNKSINQIPANLIVLQSKSYYRHLSQLLNKDTIPLNEVINCPDSIDKENIELMSFDGEELEFKFNKKYIMLVNVQKSHSQLIGFKIENCK